jgi:hypothetical protein
MQWTAPTTGIVMSQIRVAEQLAASLLVAYLCLMCQNVTRDQRIEGWRATVELLSVFRPGRVGVMAAALVAYLHRSIFAAGARRARTADSG